MDPSDWATMDGNQGAEWDAKPAAPSADWDTVGDSNGNGQESAQFGDNSPPAVTQDWGSSSVPPTTQASEPTVAPTQDWGSPSQVDPGNTDNSEGNANGESGWGQTESNDAGDAKPEPEAEVPFVAPKISQQKCEYEVTPRLYTYMSVNGKTFGEDWQALLKNNDSRQAPTYQVTLYQKEANLTACIDIDITASRKMGPKVNPTGLPYFKSTLSIAAIDIVDMKVYTPGGFTLDKEFNAPKGFSNKDKCLVTFKTPRVLFQNRAVPKLEFESTESHLRALFEELGKIDKSNMVEFKIIMNYTTKGEGGLSVLLDNMMRRTEKDSKRNPMFEWCKESPNKHCLNWGNLFDADERPYLSTPNMVCKLRRVHSDDISAHVPLAYAAKDEYAYQEGLAAEIAVELMRCAFLPIPSSVGKLNENDNELPKMYLCDALWASENLDQPKEGDVFELDMSIFPLPPCPPCTGPKKLRPQADNDGEEDNRHDGSEVWRQTTETPEEKAERIEEMRQEHIDQQCRKWRFVVLGSSSVSSTGHVLGVVYRAIDRRWDGADPDMAPTVGTIVPTLETRVQSLSRLVEILRDTNQRHNISFKRKLSPQSTKDVIRLLNDFYTASNARPDIETKFHNHVKHLLVSGDTSVPYPVINFHDEIHPDWKVLIQGMSKYHQNLFETKLREIEHGLVVITGVPASRKTSFMIIMALLYMFKPDAVDHKVLMVTDTNSGVNDMMKRLTSMAESFQSKSSDKLKRLLFIRFHSPDIETSKLVAKYIPIEERKYLNGDLDSSFVVEQWLNATASDQREKAKKGDSRFDSSIIEMSLNEAMQAEMDSDPNNQDWITLQEKLVGKRDNPRDQGNSWADINALISRLRVITMSKAAAVGTTCDMANRTLLAEIFTPTMYLKDEDCRSPAWYFRTNVAAHRCLKFAVLGGDPLQKDVYLPSDKMGYPSAFGKYATHSAHQQLSEHGLEVMPLMEQYRMRNKEFVRFLSQLYYNRAMLDGLRDEPRTPQETFCRRFINKTYKINNTNVAMVTVTGTKARKEEGGTSTTNDGMFAHIKEVLLDFKRDLDSANVPFDKSKFKIGVGCSYLAIVNPLRIFIGDILKDLRFEAVTGEVAQGLEYDFFIRATPNERVSSFAGDKKECLVLDTRFRYGYVHLITEQSIDPKSYTKHGDAALLHGDAKLVFETYIWLNGKNWTTSKEVKSMNCHICHGIGHMSSNCPERGSKYCWNCHQTTHIPQNCPYPKSGGRPVPRDSKGAPKPCIRCKSTDHHVEDCKIPWCQKCKKNTHSFEECPFARCRYCRNQPGHWADTPQCPKYNAQPKTKKDGTKFTRLNLLQTSSQAPNQEKLDTIKEAEELLLAQDKSLEEHEIEQVNQLALVRGIEASLRSWRAEYEEHWMSAPTSQEQEEVQLNQAIQESIQTANTGRRFLAAFGLSSRKSSPDWPEPDALGVLHYSDGEIHKDQMPFPHGDDTSYYRHGEYLTFSYPRVAGKVLSQKFSTGDGIVLTLKGEYFPGYRWMGKSGVVTTWFESIDKSWASSLPEGQVYCTESRLDQFMTSEEYETHSVAKAAEAEAAEAEKKAEIEAKKAAEEAEKVKKEAEEAKTTNTDA